MQLFDRNCVCPAFSMVCLLALCSNNEHVYFKKVFDCMCCFVADMTTKSCYITRPSAWFPEVDDSGHSGMCEFYNPFQRLPKHHGLAKRAKFFGDL